MLKIEKFTEKIYTQFSTYIFSGDISRVRMGPGKPESPGILLWHFPGLESPGKRPLVLESPGNLLN